MPDGFLSWKQPNQYFPQRRKSCAENQGNQQEKSNSRDESEGEESNFDKITQPSARHTPDAPNRVERILKLNEYAGCAYEECDHRENCRPNARVWLVRSADEGLDRFPASAADQTRNLTEQFAPGRFLAEPETGNRQHNHEKRCNGKKSVEGQSRASGNDGPIH